MQNHQLIQLNILVKILHKFQALKRSLGLDLENRLHKHKILFESLCLTKHKKITAQLLQNKILNLRNNHLNS
jgi:hypothetical protein